MILLTPTLLGLIPSVEINDHQLSFLKLVVIFFGFGGLFSAIGAYLWDRWRFRKGDDGQSIEVYGVKYEQTGIHPALELPVGKVSVQVWGNHADMPDVLGKFNRRLVKIAVDAISHATQSNPIVWIADAKTRRWILGRLDARVDGNDPQGNVDRIMERPTQDDRLACVMTGGIDPSGIFTGTLVVFNPERAEYYANPEVHANKLCTAVDEWADHVPHLLHFAARAWLDRKKPDSTAFAWTAQVSTRSLEPAGMKEVIRLLGVILKLVSREKVS